MRTTNGLKLKMRIRKKLIKNPPLRKQILKIIKKGANLTAVVKASLKKS